MKVRFREQYSDSNPRIAYELVSDEHIFDEEDSQEWCYNVKLFGLIPVRKMEETNDETDIPAIDVFVKLYNI